MYAFGFFRILTTLSESDPAWPIVSAGMLVTRAAGSAVYGDRLQTLQASGRQHIALIADLPTRRRLSAITSEIDAYAIGRDGSPLASVMFEYGDELMAAGLTPAAADVFKIVSDTPRIHPDLRLRAMLRRGHAYRMLGQFDDAESVYFLLAAFAKETRSLTVELEADLARSRLALDRGNVQAAEPILRDVLRRASKNGKTAILARARISAARIAGLRNQPHRVVEYSYLSLRGLTQSIDIDRARNNLAYALRELNRLEAADALAERIIAETQHANQRAIALILRLHLALDFEEMDDAARFRQQLDRDSREPLVDAEYAEAIMRHEAILGNSAGAATALARMEAIAQQHGFNELETRAERARAALTRGLIPRLFEFQPVYLSKADRRRVDRVDIAVRRQFAAAR